MPDDFKLPCIFYQTAFYVTTLHVPTNIDLSKYSFQFCTCAKNGASRHTCADTTRVTSMYRATSLCCDVSVSAAFCTVCVFVCDVTVGLVANSKKSISVEDLKTVGQGQQQQKVEVEPEHVLIQPDEVHVSAVLDTPSTSTTSTEKLDEPPTSPALASPVPKAAAEAAAATTTTDSPSLIRESRVVTP